jgi:cytidylate kinase
MPTLARPLVVALDGPGSSGKSSVGSAAAARLGFRFFDTGLLYRALTWLAVERAVAPDDPGLPGLADEIEVRADAAGRLDRVAVAGADVTDAVRTGAVDAQVSAYAAVPELRRALLARQRALAEGGGIVMAGRDIGTVVLPDAGLKLYLDASVEERARRRADERGLAPDDPERAEILESLRARDGLDAGRPVAPLRPADDAVVIRTDGQAFETTVDQVVAAIEARLAGPATGDGGDQHAARGRQGVGADRGSEAAVPRRTRRPPLAPTPIADHINLVIRVGSFVMRTLARALTRVTIEGDLDAIPRTGPLLVAANHTSSADPVLIGSFLNQRLKRPLNWLGKREIFDWPVISWLGRHGGVHPVDRSGADVEAFRAATRILTAGHILAVFPEGTRSPDGALQRAKDGVAVLALRTGAPVLPVGVIDSDRFWPKGRFLPRFGGRVIVRIGRPFDVATELGATQPAGTHRLPKEAATELIMGRIAALLPERQRGVYGERPTR